MSLKYKFYKDRNLLVDVFEGELRLSDFRKLYIAERENLDFSEINKSISDLRSIKLKASLAEVKDFLKFMQPANDNKTSKWAVLTESPIQTALSLMLRMDSRYKDIVRVFSTIEGCNTFLNVNYSEREFEDEDFIVVE
ncbi:hypothetical protein [Maribellus maritimus]|uniref:hypothetical protein n=1 Tax=Maribellus maritimus TaxID=2870838 RepID=UPI001EEB6005|nr:hypothetical protein [Maribellus maritimus]MCG6186816.1 hypothetical protein [Maribellus maritimus]